MLTAEILSMCRQGLDLQVSTCTRRPPQVALRTEKMLAPLPGTTAVEGVDPFTTDTLCVWHAARCQRMIQVYTQHSTPK